MPQHYISNHISGCTGCGKMCQYEPEDISSITLFLFIFGQGTKSYGLCLPAHEEHCLTAALTDRFYSG